MSSLLLSIQKQVKKFQTNEWKKKQPDAEKNSVSRSCFQSFCEELLFISFCFFFFVLVSIPMTMINMSSSSCDEKSSFFILDFPRLSLSNIYLSPVVRLKMVSLRLCSYRSGNIMKIMSISILSKAS